MDRRLFGRVLLFIVLLATLAGCACGPQTMMADAGPPPAPAPQVREAPAPQPPQALPPRRDRG